MGVNRPIIERDEMNKVILMGRLTRDPDFNTTANGNVVARFTIAIDRRFKTDGQETDFPSCVAFSKTAEFMKKYFHKGMKILVEGRLQTGSYEKDGVKHYTTDVIVESVEFAESKRDSAEDNGFVVPDGIEDELPFK